MSLESLIETYLDARRMAFSRPVPFQEARDALLAQDRTAVMTAFETRRQLPDEDERARALEGSAILYGTDATEFLIRGLDDASSVVRWVACGCLHDVGDHRAHGALCERMRHDGDPQVRGEVVSALGRLKVLDVLPELERVRQVDHEVDPLGHTPSSQAAEAITDLLNRWVFDQISGDPPRTFTSTTLTGTLTGRVVMEGLPVDEEGRVITTPRYAALPREAWSHGWLSRLDLRTTLRSAFEIDVRYDDPACVLRRRFVIHELPDGGVVNWAVHTMLDPSGLEDGPQIVEPPGQ